MLYLNKLILIYFYAQIIITVHLSIFLIQLYFIENLLPHQRDKSTQFIFTQPHIGK